MSENNAQDQKPTLDLETRQAINLALTNQNTILQLTDSGRSAQRRRRQLQRDRAQREQYLAKKAAESAQAQSEQGGSTSFDSTTSEPQEFFDAQEEPSISIEKGSENQGTPTTGLRHTVELLEAILMPSSRSSITTATIMDVDAIHASRQEEITRQWLVVINGIGHNITKLASMFNNNKPCYPFSIAGGSFNYCIAVEFEDCQVNRTRWMIRLPIPGRVMDPETKIKHEAATMRYLYENTSIPVPKVIASGTTYDNCFVGVGPFIIMEYVEGKPLSEILIGTPLDELFRSRTVEEQLKEVADRAEASRVEEDDDGPLLSPEISDDTLTIIYRQIANIYLELAEHKFDAIGSLSKVKTRKGWSWLVEDPPHTLSNNEHQRNGAVPADDTTEPFETTASYLNHLVNLELTSLDSQRNSIEDGNDAREKYTSRHLLRTLLFRLIPAKHTKGPYHLVCDDLRPHNILINRSLQIVAICDWEWTYTAPFELFSSAPPWLILRNPDEWTQNYHFDRPGPDDLLEYYERKLDLFLKVMEEEEVRRWEAKRFDPRVRDFAYEKRRTANGINGKHLTPAVEVSFPTPTRNAPVPVVYYDVLKPPRDSLSSRMRASLSSGLFWLTSLLQGGSFERLYWQRLDELCFGDRESAEKRVKDWAEREGREEEMKEWVKRKMKDLQVYQAELKNLEAGREKEMEEAEIFWEAVEDIE